ncbi:hypothetical protein Tco_1363965 [Tanacetum coccineum]
MPSEPFILVFLHQRMRNQRIAKVDLEVCEVGQGLGCDFSLSCCMERVEDVYLKGQPKLGLWYPKDSPFNLVAYTDSDYAGASLDRKSTIGGKAKKHVRLMMEKLFGMELELILVTQS